MGEQYRIDELARKAKVASTTVRLYRSKGLLAPPRLEGRTGWYDEAHLSRLRLIARLQADGYSLAGIGDLLRQWEEGRSLDAVIGVVLDVAEVLERFPAGAMTPELMQRAGRLGLVEVTDDGRVRVADRRLLDTGADLAHLGIPVDVILDELEALVAHTDEIAGRFVALFEQHLAPDDWRTDLGSDEARALAATLARLQATARQVLVATLDGSVARLGRERLGQLLADPGSATGRSYDEPGGR